MVDLTTNYLGLELANPLVPSASPLSRSLDTARELEDAGASAIVMYSLFEEELRQEEEMMTRFLIEQEIGHAEAHGFLPFADAYVRGLDQYLEQVAALKRNLHIPVIASLNGVSVSGWVEHGKMLQEAGADALELNVYFVAANAEQSAADVEARYLALLRALRAQVDVPITMKLSPQFSALPNFIRQLETAGASGVALFNRFYQPDIDVESLRVTPQLQLSRSEEALLRVRWIALLYGRIRLSLAATGGVHTAQDAIKLLLAGADVVHLCSALLMHGPQRLADIRRDMEDWLARSEFRSVNELKGLVSQQRAPDPAPFERANYVWVLDSYSAGSGVRR